MRQNRIIIAFALILLFQFVGLLAVQKNLSDQNKVISEINSKLIKLDNTLMAKVDKPEYRQLIGQVNGCIREVEYLKQDFSEWGGLWNSLFDRSQRAYMHRGKE